MLLHNILVGPKILETWDPAEENKNRVLYQKATAELTRKIENAIEKWEEKLNTQEGFFKGMLVTYEVPNPFVIFSEKPEDIPATTRAKKSITLLIENFYASLARRSTYSLVIPNKEADYLILGILQHFFPGKYKKEFKPINRETDAEALAKICSRYFKRILS